MSNNLYFIGIIAKALSQRETGESLKQAFEEIRSLGSKPEYKQGFRQFKRFMNVIKDHVKKKHSNMLEADLISEMIIDMATDNFDGNDKDKQEVLNIIKSYPQLQKEHEQFVAEIKGLSRKSKGIGISVSRGNRIIGSVTFADIPASKTIYDITPGIYSIAFDTGRLIWKGELAGQDLVWARAYPGKPVKLAADTTQRKANPTRKISFFNGEIIIRVFAGIESGRIVIILKTLGDSK